MGLGKSVRTDGIPAIGISKKKIGIYEVFNVYLYWIFEYIELLKIF